MTPLNALLAVTDFSAPARHAADRAARLAHETGAQVTLMHVVSGRTMDDLRLWLGAGRLLDEIAHQADAASADLVVLGARGAGFLRRLMLGTRPV